MHTTSGNLLRGTTMPLPMPRLPSVLVIDGEDGIREAIRYVPEDEGYTVYEAPDGKPALARLREHPLCGLRRRDPEGSAVHIKRKEFTHP